MKLLYNYVLLLNLELSFLDSFLLIEKRYVEIVCDTCRILHYNSRIQLNTSTINIIEGTKTWSDAFLQLEPTDFIRHTASASNTEVAIIFNEWEKML